jgi:hypothetical protein
MNSFELFGGMLMVTNLVAAYFFYEKNIDPTVQLVLAAIGGIILITGFLQ